MQFTTIGQFQLITGRAQGTQQSAGQIPGNAGFGSFMAAADMSRDATPAASTPVDPDPINTAALAAAKLAVAEQRNWIDGNFRRTSRDLAANMSDDDKAKLQALVDTGQLGWEDIDAALDAKIKLATTEMLTGQSADLNKMPSGWQASKDAWQAYQDWDLAERAGKSEIYARYSEKFAEIMASDPGPTEGTDTDPHALEKLMAREGVLDRYRKIRDQELADLSQRLGQQPARPTTLPVGANPYEIALFEGRLTPADTTAMAKLDAAGFTSSGAFKDALTRLASEISTNVANALSR